MGISTENGSTKLTFSFKETRSGSLPISKVFLISSIQGPLGLPLGVLGSSSLGGSELLLLYFGQGPDIDDLPVPMINICCNGARLVNR